MTECHFVDGSEFQRLAKKRQIPDGLNGTYSIDLAASDFVGNAINFCRGRIHHAYDAGSRQPALTLRQQLIVGNLRAHPGICQHVVLVQM